MYAPFVFSQTKIFGVVTDSLGVPVAFAPVGLMSQAEHAVIKGTMTDENGKYVLDKLKRCTCLLKVSASGYQEKLIENLDLDSAKNDLELNITLNASAINLKGVAVVASKKIVEFKNNNITVNIEDSPLAQGNSVLDVLVKIPGVTIDDKKIQILGKTGVSVMIDDRPQMLSGDQLMNVLKSMNADLVKSIEVLKNPPVKYDASGTSGMINIKTKKTTVNGTTGSVFSSYSQGFYPQAMSGASLNYKTKKLTFYSAISADYHLGRSIQTFKRRFTTDSSLSILNTDNLVRGKDRNLNYKAGIDWYPTKVDIIGMKIEGAPGKYSEGINSRTYLMGDSSYDHLNSQLNFLGYWNSTNVNFNYEHKRDTLGSLFSIVGDYTLLPGRASSEIRTNFFNVNETVAKPANNINSLNFGKSNVLSARADLVQVIDSASSVEGGVKVSNSSTKNNYQIERDSSGTSLFIKDMDLSNNFEYDEMTYAAYINCKKSIRKLTMNLGVRFENTDLKGENTSKNFKIQKRYLNVFPNLMFDYRKSETHDFQLNLSRRINRPNFDDLNPFQIFMDQYTYQQGNPFLLPDYSNKAEVSYNYKQSLNVSVAYSYIEHVILGYTLQYDSIKITDGRIKNMKSSQLLECSIYYQKSITSKWDISINGTFTEVNYRGDIGGVDFNRTSLNYNGNLSSSFLLLKKWKLELSGFYAGPSYYQVLKREARWSMSAAVKTSLCKDKLDLTLGVDDIFYSLSWRTSFNFENQNWNFKQVSDSRRFRIALNYTFGKIKIDERTVNSSNEEEKRRLNH